MKCLKWLKLISLITILINIQVCMNNEVNNDPKAQGDNTMYAQKGADWPGLCNTGFRQSPVNIIDGSNTIKSIDIEYKLPKDAAKNKLYYDGDRVFMDIKLGNITYFNEKGSKEIFEANRIELHFPAEHYVTMNGQTPRYALEIQIYHTLMKTDNLLITNQVIKLQKAVISILFTQGELSEGDIFLNQLGISKYNTDEEEKFFIAKPHNFITRKKVIPATYGVGFNSLAFQGLLNLINADKHMFFYYGSETTPPCREEVLWMVFAQPRSFSKPQFDYLLLMLAKNKKKGKTLLDARTPNQLLGNKRALILWDETMRGKIFSNKIGLRSVRNKSYFSSE